jgi:hypothetical protein
LFGFLKEAFKEDQLLFVNAASLDQEVSARVVEEDVRDVFRFSFTNGGSCGFGGLGGARGAGHLGFFTIVKKTLNINYFNN